MTGRWQHFLSERPRAADALLALALFAIAFPGSRFAAEGVAAPDPWWPAVVLAAVACTALLWQRTRPHAVTVVTTICAMAMAALGFLLTVLLIAPLMVALYSLAARTNRKTTYVFSIVVVAVLVMTAVLAEPGQKSVYLKIVGPEAWLLLPPVLGSLTRLRQAYVASVQARAEHAERTREDEARHRVAEERMRIARDLHDVVAHHLALANAQAGAVAHLLRGDPGRAEKIAADLTGTTSSALRELKATVGLLRAADDTGPTLEPAPGLERLPDLVASFASAGLAVTVATVGQSRPLSPGVNLTAYRIVQEALTNVAKHADTAHAEVRIGYARDLLRITVTDEADPSSRTPAANPGYGLVGMRERALSLGGGLRAGPRPDRGFEVTAELPLYPPAREEGPKS
jgi:signal transduction histidine kinase